MRSTLSLPLAVALGLGACPALADEPPAVSSAGSPRVAISYTRAKGAEKCPDGDRLRHLIIGSVGSAVEIVDGASAPETIEVNVARKHGRFVAEWKWEGSDKPDRVMEDDLCDRLIENTAASIVVNVKPRPVLAAPKAAATDPVRQGAAPPAAPSPAPAPRQPGAFEGRAGIARIVVFTVAGAAIGVGSGFAVVAARKAGAIDAIDGPLGASGCVASGGPVPPQCMQLSSLLREHDTYAKAAIGLTAGGAVTGALAVASIWIVRTPSHAVEVTPAAPGALAGVAVRGAW